MTSNVDALRIRAALGRDTWEPPQPMGPDGWKFQRKDRSASIIVTCAPWDDGVEWVHASIAPSDHLPAYGDLVELHDVVWRGRGYAFQVFAPRSAHVNIHPHALHLWGRLDGSNPLPDFGQAGTI